MNERSIFDVTVPNATTPTWYDVRIGKKGSSPQPRTQACRETPPTAMLVFWDVDLGASYKASLSLTSFLFLFRFFLHLYLYTFSKHYISFAIVQPWSYQISIFSLEKYTVILLKHVVKVLNFNFRRADLVADLKTSPSCLLNVNVILRLLCRLY